MPIRTSGPGSGMKLSSKTITFDGTAGNGAAGTVSWFTVTGDVLIGTISGFCSVDLTGATSTITLGVTNATALFIAATTCTTLDAGTFWVSTTATANGIALPAATKDVIITQNIVTTIATADTTAGTLRVDIYWLPLSSDGLVVPA